MYDTVYSRGSPAEAVVAAALRGVLCEKEESGGGSFQPCRLVVPIIAGSVALRSGTTPPTTDTGGPLRGGEEREREREREREGGY